MKLLSGFLLFELILMSGCEPHDSTSNTPTLSTHNANLAVIREVLFPQDLWLPGQVIAAREISISGRVEGYLHRVYAKEGALISKGTLLAEIKDTAIEARITQAEANIRVTQANLDDARADAQRFQTLADTHALAEDQLRDARVRVIAADAELDKAKAELQSRLTDRHHLSLTAPEDSILVERLLEAGELAEVGSPILRLESLERELEVFVPGSWLQHIKLGMPLAIRIDGYREMETPIIKVIPSSDSISRQIKIRTGLPEEQGIIPGTYAQAKLIRGYDPSPAVPLAALTERAGIIGTFVVGKNGSARFRSLRLGREWSQQREVLAGLSIDERVVLSPAPRLRDGDRILDQ